MKIRVQQEIFAKNEEVTDLIFKDLKDREERTCPASLPDFVLVVFAVQAQIKTYVVTLTNRNS